MIKLIKNIKFKMWYMVTLIFLIIIGVTIKTTFSATKTTVSIDEFRKIIVDTGLSYWYNKSFTDYEQKFINGTTYTNGTFSSNSSVGTVNWRNFNQTPESISRSNKINIDCSSFVGSVLINSIGYDFSEYYSLFGLSSSDEYKRSYTNKGKALNTANLIKIAENNKKIKIYYKSYSSNTYISDSDYNNIKSKLEKGDVIVYRRVKANGSAGGHVLLYIGDEYSTGAELLHATGSDYSDWTNPVSGTVYNSTSEDTNSVRLNSLSLLKTVGITEIAVLRPSNKFCDGDTCELKNCTTDECTYSYSNVSVPSSNLLRKNAIARTYLSKLRTEQYVSKQKNSIDEGEVAQYISTKTSTISKGDVLIYQLYTNNMSDNYFCSGANGTGDKLNKADCEASDGTWKKPSTGENKIYIGSAKYNSALGKKYYGLTITAKIPTGTEYVSCNHSCSYNKDTSTITWNNFDAINESTFRFYVRVKSNATGNVTFDGMNIKIVNSSSSTEYLQMSSISTKIASTLNNTQVDELRTYVNNFSTLLKNNKIEFSSSADASNYKKVDLTKSTSSSTIKLRQIDLVKAVYYNMGMDAGFSNLTGSNVKKNIFKLVDGLYYNINSISDLDDSYKYIREMMVPHGYGGTLLSGYYLNRAHYLNTNYLEPGDVIFTFYRNTSGGDYVTSAYMYLGDEENNAISYRTSNSKPVFAYFTSNSDTLIYTGSEAKNLMRQIYLKNLFVILRPSVLSNTVMLDYGDNENHPSIIQYGKYTSLPDSSDTKKTYTINFYDNSSLYKKITKNAYIDGWYTPDGKVVKNDSSLYSDSDHTLSAKWEDGTFTFPECKKDGYDFVGWYSDKKLTKKVGNVGDSYNLIGRSSSLSFYAKFELAKYEINFELNGGIGTDTLIEAYYNESVELPTPTKEGYTFLGWYLDNEFNEAFTTMPNKDITLYAKWILNDPEVLYYTISYNTNGGINNSSNKIKCSSLEKEIFYEPTKEGYTFIEWNTKADGSGDSYLLNNEYDIISDLTLYAIWEANDYTINYNTNGGSLIDTDTYKYNDTIIEPDEPIKNGYRFVGWYTSDDIEYVFLQMPSEDITLYAKWELINYNITYAYNDIESVIKYNIESDTFSLPDLNIEGYVVAGWLDEDGNTLSSVTINKGSYGNKKYEVILNPITYTVIYDGNGGIGSMENSTFKYDEEVTFSENTFTKEGYSFVGWNFNKDAVEDITVENKILSALCNTEGCTKTVYAIWKKNAVKVSVTVENGTVDKKNATYINGDLPVFELSTGNDYEYKNVVCTNNQIAVVENNILTFNYLTYDTNCTVYFEKINNAGELTEFKIDNNKNVIKGLSVNTDIDDLKNELNTNNYDYEIIDVSGKNITNNRNLRTGDVVKLNIDDEYRNYTISVRGDVLGDGKISNDGALVVSKYLLNKEKNSMKNEYLISADYNDDGKVKINDVVKMLKDIKRDE